MGLRPHHFGACPGPCLERGAVAALGWDPFMCQCPDVVPGIGGWAEPLSHPKGARAASALDSWGLPWTPCRSDQEQVSTQQLEGEAHCRLDGRHCH